MFILCYNVENNKIDEITQRLQLIDDVCDISYENLIKVTQNEDVNDYSMEEDDHATLMVSFNGEFEELRSFNKVIQPIIGEKCFNILEE